MAKPISEPAMVVDTFATGMEAPTERRGVVRLVFLADRSIGEEEERAIVARVAMPKEAFLEALALMLRTVGAPM